MLQCVTKQIQRCLLTPPFQSRLSLQGSLSFSFLVLLFLLSLYLDSFAFLYVTISSFASLPTRYYSGMTHVTHGRMDAWTHGRMDAWTHGRMDAWTHGRMDAWTHGRMDAWTHGRMDAETPRIHLYCMYPLHNISLRAYHQCPMFSVGVV